MNFKKRLLPVVVLLGTLTVRTAPSEAQAQRPPSPLTLQQAIQYAVDNYPAISASMARIAAQEAGVDLARAAYLPRLESSFFENRATRNNVAGLLLPGSLIPPISGPVSETNWGKYLGQRRIDGVFLGAY